MHFGRGSVSRPRQYGLGWLLIGVAVLALPVSTYLLPFRAEAALPPGPAAAFSSDSGVRIGPTAVADAHRRPGRSQLGQPFGGSMLSLVTMQWTFHYTPAYTKALSLAVNGAPAGASVLIACHGRGCPFTAHLTVIGGVSRRPRDREGGYGYGYGHGTGGHRRCGSEGDGHRGCGCGADAQGGCGCGVNGQGGCQTGVTLELGSYFQRHRLGVGTRITVAITRRWWIGKYYLFKTRAGHAPRVHVACLAPGETQPGVAC